jgi:hypothetical protein
MPSSLHEVFVEFVRQRPAFVAELLVGPLNVELPDFGETRLDSCDFTSVLPTEYPADAVVTFTKRGVPVFAVVVEAQRSRAAKKRLTWPVYLATLRARLNCTTALLVLCDDDGVAQWCAEPIAVSYPGCVVTPLVLGPGRVPLVTDPAVARTNPELAVLSALAHGAGPGRRPIFIALLAALGKVEDDYEQLYYDVVFAGLPKAAQLDLEEILMTVTANSEFRSDFLRRFAEKRRAEGRAEGVAEGLAEGLADGMARGESAAVLAVLAARNIAVPEVVRDRITNCLDLVQLESWVRRAATATTVSDLFES